MDAGYSGTPLPKKLGLKEGSRLRLLSAPEGFLYEQTPIDGPFDVAVAFCITLVDLELAFASLKPDLDPKGGLWIAWPKRASKVPTQLSDGIVREFGLATGLVDNKVCAIDETWSGLRFVVRVKDR